MMRGGGRLQRQNIQYQTVHLSESLSMVLNHSTTPINLEQVESLRRHFIKRLPKQRLSSIKTKGDMCFNAKNGKMAFFLFFASLSDLTHRQMYHVSVQTLWHFRLVAGPTYWPKASMFDNLGMIFNVLQIAPLKWGGNTCWDMAVGVAFRKKDMQILFKSYDEFKSF